MHAGGAVNVVATTLGGDTVPLSFSYVAPLIASLNPDTGGIAGGQTVTILGAFLTGVTSVKFGDVPAKSFKVDSASQLSVVTPAHPVGVVDVVLTSTTGVDTLANGFTFVVAPVVSDLAPDTGPVNGQQLVRLFPCKRRQPPRRIRIRHVQSCGTPDRLRQPRRGRRVDLRQPHAVRAR